MTADLERLRGLIEKCPEEWKSASREGDDWESVVYIPGTPYEVCQCFHDEEDKDKCEANTQLIAAMKNALPALLAEVEQLRAAVSDAETVINRGVELMTTDQVGQWTGVRHWLETQTIDAAQEGK